MLILSQLGRPWTRVPRVKKCREVPRKCATSPAAWVRGEKQARTAHGSGGAVAYGAGGGREAAGAARGLGAERQGIRAGGVTQ